MEGAVGVAQPDQVLAAHVVVHLGEEALSSATSAEPNSGTVTRTAIASSAIRIE